jgi:hypothetical protein
VDVFQVIACCQDAVADTLFLDIHMVGIEMNEDVVGADALDHLHRLAAGIDQMVLVAVDGLYAELETPPLGMLGCGRQSPGDVVIFLLCWGNAGTLADAAVDHARKGLAAKIGGFIDSDGKMVDGRVGPD